MSEATVEGLLDTAVRRPMLAAELGLALGLVSTFSGGRVAKWSHVLGLRREAPSRPLTWFVLAILVGALSWAVSLSGLTPAAKAIGLGLIWGHTGMDFANNARAAAALRAVAADGATLGAWLAVPLRARLAVTNAIGGAVTAMLAIAALLTLHPGLFGLFLGALAQLAGQRRAAEQALSRELAEDLQPPTDEGADARDGSVS